MGSFTRHDLFVQELTRLIEEDMQRFKDEMSLGLLKTLEDYKALAGKISGLRHALELIEEAESSVERKIGS